MLILIHVIIALASVAFTTYVFFAPTKTRLNVSYGLVAATIASGTFLVVANPTHIIQACTTGLIYLGVVMTAIVAARSRLAHV